MVGKQYNRAVGNIYPEHSSSSAATSRRFLVDTFTILLIIALVLSLPGSLFIGYRLSTRRAKMASVIAGVIGTVAVAVAIYYFVNNNSISLDGLSYFLGAFFACSVGSFTGTLLANFAIGTGDRTGGLSPSEFS